MADNALTRLLTGVGSSLLGKGTNYDATPDARAYKLHVAEYQSLGKTPMTPAEFARLQRGEWCPTNPQFGIYSIQSGQIIDPIDAKFDAVAKAVISAKNGIQQATNKLNENKDLSVKYPLQQATPKQIPLDLGIEVQKDINGVPAFSGKIGTFA